MRTEARHGVVLTIGTGVTAVLGFIYVIFVQRALGRDASADFVAALSFVAFCQIALGPINGSTARFTAQYAGRGEMGKVRSLCWIMATRVALLGIVGLSLGLIVLSPLTNLWRFESMSSLLTAYLIVYMLLVLSVARGVLRGLQAFGHLNFNTILEAAVRLFLGMAFLEIARNAQAGLAAYLAALIVILAVSHRQLRSVWRGSRREPIDGGDIKRFTGLMFLVMFTSAGFQNVDMLTVKHFMATSDAGLYGAAFTLGRIMGALATPFTTLLLPLLATLHEKSEQATAAFLRITSYYLALATVPLVLFAFWPDRVMGLVYSEEFAPAAEVLFIVTVARLLTYFCHMLALIGAAAGEFHMLWVYLPGLLGQALALFFWHDSLETVANVMIIGQAATMIALITFYGSRGERRPRPGSH